jgi:hypothetical protein
MPANAREGVTGGPKRTALTGSLGRKRTTLTGSRRPGSDEAQRQI